MTFTNSPIIHPGTFEITEELAAMQKWTTPASHLFKDLTVCWHKLGLKREKLAGVVYNGYPNLTGKNVGFLQRIQDKVTYMNPEMKLVFLHCVINQEM